MALHEGCKFQIVGAIQARYPHGADLPLPEELAAELTEMVPQFVPQFLSQAPSRSGPSPSYEEVAGLAVAAAYGPRDVGPPTDAVLNAIVAAGRFPQPLTQLSVERILVHGVLLPHGDRPGWTERWPAAYDLFFHLIQQQLWLPVEWIFKKVVRDTAF